MYNKLDCLVGFLKLGLESVVRPDHLSQLLFDALKAFHHRLHRDVVL